MEFHRSSRFISAELIKQQPVLEGVNDLLFWSCFSSSAMDVKIHGFGTDFNHKVLSSFDGARPFSSQGTARNIDRYILWGDASSHRAFLTLRELRIAKY
ncbi:hypothetical protein K503DRAFT_279754 [Rhizopogon vinicolor AM-OR11-026]|uniref:Uncharacterized protein n=1 Tax=Rhizopogon vinicolor AM-OR11-026 TaxID=1314800 RepID=A0A1B7MVX3_9AGAM|nr:hypothetical protein K503DRAFT_279754 [Rhizopogon vinicolor AM-OR11-026]